MANFRTGDPLAPLSLFMIVRRAQDQVTTATGACGLVSRQCQTVGVARYFREGDLKRQTIPCKRHGACSVDTPTLGRGGVWRDASPEKFKGCMGLTRNP